MKQLLILLTLFVHSIAINASTETFDIFGVEASTKAKILKACAKPIKQHSRFVTKLYPLAKVPNETILLKKEALEQAILEQARKLGEFSVAKVSTVYYPDELKIYTTLDLVRQQDTNRIPKPKKKRKNKPINLSADLTELFSLWDTYQENKLSLIRENKLDFSQLQCPVPHCVWGFDQQERKEVLPKFQKGIQLHQSTLKKIIQSGTDNELRQKAIFILGHDSDYQSLAKFLLQFSDDEDDVIRNNALRVIGAIVEQHADVKLNLSRIIQALNFPLVTDRNKAAYVLAGYVRHHPKSHQRVIKQAGDTLLAMLRLHQPNNHDFAYQILKTVSHQNFGERDFAAWEKWMHDHPQQKKSALKAL